MPVFTELRVWQMAHELAVAVYRATNAFPSHEVYGLRSQIRCAAVSVAANIAEGQKRRSTREFGNFISIAEGSLAEVQYYLLLARDLDYLKLALYEDLTGQAGEVEKMLFGLRRHLSQAKTIAGSDGRVVPMASRRKPSRSTTQRSTILERMTFLAQVSLPRQQCAARAQCD